jgi:RHH-type proline utilization regulon transcriptional repressor/proline dehydrogenase/delta 1-pyrroline-5-carboxylate dehydrogenase
MTTADAAAQAPTIPDDATLITRSEHLARRLLDRSAQLSSGPERRRSARLAALLGDEAGRDLLLDLTDQVLRIRDPRRAATRLHDLTGGGVPASLSRFDRLGLAVLGRVAPLAPRLADGAVDWRIDRDTAGVILDASDPAFASHVRSRRRDGYRLNINVLGESILGDDEAAERSRKVLERIQRPDVDYVSVKISALCANLDVLAERDSLDRIADRLRTLYRAADAQQPPTFVNLDMEEYRDLELSLVSFMSVLDEPEFHGTRAGIVLQAYVPDSHAALDRLCEWANARYASGGAGIKIRLVKGANLAMERVEAELHDWPQAPYPDKAAVDASFKRMLERALTYGAPGAVRIGVASHNLFEIAYAMTLASALGATERLDLEMLEGMAPAQARAVQEMFGELLLYAPVVERSDREASIAYLSRRLDENSSPENFLRSLFDITPGSPTWHLEAKRFRTSVSQRHTVSTDSRRTQSRATRLAPSSPDGPFVNAPDTDFTQAANREWIADALATAAPGEPTLVDSVEGVERLVDDALDAQRAWTESSWAERRSLLARAADVMESERGETIALMARTSGKTVPEADPEISEAVDFARYAGHLTRRHEELAASGLQWTPARVVVVAGPWNFPYAIPASGLVHALAAGAAVIVKPAPETRAVAAHLVRQLHAAGVPPTLVQLAATPDDEVGQRLITHESVDLVMLTGSYDTASMFLGWRPDLALQAETSGKNALVITAAADLDQAIKDLVRSAFGHAGQKCSAASLAIVEASVYDDPAFHRRLADAVTSLRAGEATDPATRVGPLISAPGPTLRRGLTQLDDAERWLVEPRALNDEQTSWTPGVRVGVEAGSWFHLTECFGPVLGVMRAQSLDHAIELQNATRYGLTGGLHSLDPREIDHWLSRVQVGNAYVNRHITGAIVQRQPFGGWKASSIGAGHKPGGPHHLDGYGTWTEPSADAATAAESFRRAWDGYFSLEHDPTGLVSERNTLRFRPLDEVICLIPDQHADSRALVEAAAQVTGVPLLLVADDDEAREAIGVVTDRDFTRVRVPFGCDDQLLVEAHGLGIVVDRAPIVSDGRVELTHWVLEQAISRTMHRYGRVLGG